MREKTRVMVVKVLIEIIVDNVAMKPTDIVYVFRVHLADLLIWLELR